MPAVLCSFSYVFFCFFFEQKNWKLVEWNGGYPFEEDTVRQPISLKYEFVSLMIQQSSLCAQNAVCLWGEVRGAEPYWTEISPSPCFQTWVWLPCHPPHLCHCPRPGLFLLLSFCTLSTVACFRQVVADLQEACDSVGVSECWRELELALDFLNFQWAKVMRLCYAGINPLQHCVLHLH